MIAEGFRAASNWITLLLVLLVVVEGLGLVFWLMYIREVSFGDLVSRSLATLLSALGERLLSLAQASFGLSTVRLFAAGVLAYGSIPVAVILPLLDCGLGKGERMDPRKWMLHPNRAQELVLRSAGWRLLVNTYRTRGA
jgi:hypothetical protein